MSTIVTCYYKLNNSKHSISDYDKWIKNLLLHLNNNVIVFTSKVDKNYLLDILEQNNNIQYRIITNELNEFDLVKQYPHIWEDQEQKDPNQKCGRKKGCYILWNSKLKLLKEAIELNPFQTDKFIWNDIGNVRDERILPLLKDYPNEKHISLDKIDIVLLKAFSNAKQLFFQEEVHFSGSMFGGHKDTILKLHDKYYACFQNYIDNGLFIGCDQQLISSVCLQNTDLFNVIFPIDSRIDVWFYLYQYYSRK
jgi:hypothetical protein